MGKQGGFLQYDRCDMPKRPVDERVKDFRAVQLDNSPEELRDQAARCMDCGIPFCHDGCPLGNTIPDWNDLAYRDRWHEALARLHSTNNFPEFTSWVCPAPCESACVLGINEDAVTIKQIEWELVRRGWENNWIEAVQPARKSGRSVAIVGSGPAGLSAAQQLCRAGHRVVVFEKADRIGGLLRYGIPDFKLEKWIIDRRLQQMVEEGVEFRTGVHVGVDVSAQGLEEEYDALLLCCGSEVPRDLPIEGRELNGVHFAMDYLSQQNKRSYGDAIAEADTILAEGKRVVVIGGGDTGADCVGTAHRQSAIEITSLELLERPSPGRDADSPWPLHPRRGGTSSSYEEGGRREYGVLSKRFSGTGGRLQRLHAVRVKFGEPDENGRRAMQEIPGSEFDLPVDLVFLAMGFVNPVHEGLLKELDVKLDARGNVAADTKGYATSKPGVFAAGDVRRGQSLVVWAMAEGREAASAIDRFLRGDKGRRPV
jgi:glutamate synthase (NADPH) small chain